MSMIDYKNSAEAARTNAADDIPWPQPPGAVRDQMMKLGDDLLLHGTRFSVPVKGAA
jgi:hypothetical protein